VRTETAKPKGDAFRFAEYLSSNAELKRLNPYWAQEQTLCKFRLKAWQILSWI